MRRYAVPRRSAPVGPEFGAVELSGDSEATTEETYEREEERDTNAMLLHCSDTFATYSLRAVSRHRVAVPFQATASDDSSHG